jgi:hypothetical protein
MKCQYQSCGVLWLCWSTFFDVKVMMFHFQMLDAGQDYRKLKTKLRGFSPQANYTDRATAAYQQS